MTTVYDAIVLGVGGIGSAARDIRLDAPNAVEVGDSDVLLIADGRKVLMVNTRAATITASADLSPPLELEPPLVSP